MKRIELLAPVGDFECLKAAVQNGADAVYLGASNFSARASAKNFDLTELEKAINYATLRNVRVYLALNTLIKNTELQEAINIAKSAYELGISAIIVQDYGLASILLKTFPDLPIHASTQMSIHNLEGANQIEKLGFKRAILAREISISEIEFISSNSNIELEVFVHGALCISYSGQCLLSSIIGVRSGNRGKCAQACRLPYELINSQNESIDKGYLLSPRDLYGLEFIPKLIDIGITSLKLEGRLKKPEYVATVTRIYRKYIDMALANKEYIISEKDKKDLLQVFNRGGFSTGHLDNSPNTNLIFKESPTNMGIYIGNVSNYNSNKGHITLNLNDTLAIGDTIYLEHESSKYRISELMLFDKNTTFANSGEIVKIGRIKGNIKSGDKIFKLDSKALSSYAKSTFLNCESVKTKLNCKISIKKDSPILIDVTGPNSLHFSLSSKVYPTNAISAPVSKERIISQFSKTGNTPFIFDTINIDLDDNLYINIADLNELRRNCIDKIEKSILQKIKRSFTNKLPCIDLIPNTLKKSPKITLLLNVLNINSNYSELKDIDRIYIPLKFFANPKYSNILKTICFSFDTYIYIPNIVKSNYRNLFINIIDKSINTYPIKGFVLSNIGNIYMLEKYKQNYEFIGNYTLNILNNSSINAFRDLDFDVITLSPELNKSDLQQICLNSQMKTELIVYGNLPVMTCGYCYIGKSNKCYPNCKELCRKDTIYYLKDRLGLKFRILPDHVQTVTTIYNSKITSISPSNLNVDFIRIDVLDENIFEITNIIKTIKHGSRLEGKSYTSGNFNRSI
ncbi:MAG: U32 family peptidase [Clostridia bacterium]|nr:U32 family peptidase [Clostridia bacterium]